MIDIQTARSGNNTKMETMVRLEQGPNEDHHNIDAQRGVGEEGASRGVLCGGDYTASGLTRRPIRGGG